MATANPKDSFMKKTMRHLVEVDRPFIAASANQTPFPDDWFDWSPKLLEDFGAIMMLTSISAYHRPKTDAPSDRPV